MMTIDEGHLCTTVGCIDTDSIQCIAVGLKLYGCINSGNHHVCNLDRTCRQRYTSADGGVFCIFSRHFIETYVDSTRYGMCMRQTNIHLDLEDVPQNEELARAVRKRRRQEHRLERRAASSVSTAADGSKTWSDVIAETGEERSQPSVKRMRFLMELPEPPRDMTAVAEATEVRTRAVAGDCGGTDSHVDGFVAIDGTDEVDTASAPRVRLLADRQATAITTAKSSAPTPVVRQTSSSRALVVRVETFAERMENLRIRRPLREYFMRYTRTDICSIIASLFDANYRDALHKIQAAAAEEVSLDTLSRYYVACVNAGVRPNAHERDALYDMCVRRVPQVTTATLDAGRSARYVAFIYELWRVAIETPYFRAERNRFRLASHTLGALYMLREPFTLAAPDGTVAATVMTEPDAFLVAHLPPQSLLRDWSVRVTTHSASRVVAVKGVARGQIEFSKTCISSGRNAIKAALLSIETEDERALVAARLRNAYVTGTFEDDSAIYWRDNMD